MQIIMELVIDIICVTFFCIGFFLIGYKAGKRKSKTKINSDIDLKEQEPCFSFFMNDDYRKAAMKSFETNKLLWKMNFYDLKSAEIKKEAETFARNEVLTDIDQYRKAVAETEDFDGDIVTYEYTVKMEFTMPYKDLEINFECMVNVTNGVVEIEDIVLNDFNSQ